MNRFDKEALVRELRRDEKFRRFAYDDADGEPLGPGKQVKGNVTVGIGRNLTTHGLTDEEALYLLENDIASIIARMEEALPWAANLDDVRKRALINLAFNVGFMGLLGFRKALAAMERSDFGTAADELENSNWVGQVGARAHRIAAMVRDGIAQE